MLERHHVAASAGSRRSIQFANDPDVAQCGCSRDSDAIFRDQGRGRTKGRTSHWIAGMSGVIVMLMGTYRRGLSLGAHNDDGGPKSLWWSPYRSGLSGQRSPGCQDHCGRDHLPAVSADGRNLTAETSLVGHLEIELETIASLMPGSPSARPRDMDEAFPCRRRACESEPFIAFKNFTCQCFSPVPRSAWPPSLLPDTSPTTLRSLRKSCLRDLPGERQLLPFGQPSTRTFDLALWKNTSSPPSSLYAAEDLWHIVDLTACACRRPARASAASTAARVRPRSPAKSTACLTAANDRRRHHRAIPPPPKRSSPPPILLSFSARDLTLLRRNHPACRPAATPFIVTHEPNAPSLRFQPPRSTAESRRICRRPGVRSWWAQYIAYKEAMCECFKSG